MAGAVLSHVPCRSRPGQPGDGGDHVGSSSGLSRGAAHHPSALCRSPWSQRSPSHSHHSADMGISGEEQQERALPLPGEPRAGPTATLVLATGLEVSRSKTA